MTNYKNCLRQFEEKYHADVFTWIQSKMKRTEPIAMLDLSIDDCTFGSILRSRLGPETTVVSAVRQDNVAVDDPLVVVKRVDISKTDALGTLEKLGKFDLILIKECLHETEDLTEFFRHLKLHNLRDSQSKMFILTRLKNPPVPLPDPAMDVWRKYAPTREQIITATSAVGFNQDCYQCSCPIKVEKTDWANVLKSRSFAAVKMSPKSTDRAIDEFIKLKSARFIEFEEKFLILLVWIRGENEPPTVPIPV